jgi:nucleoside-diphosphate-sugar epimerase
MPDLAALGGRRVFVTGAAGFLGAHVSRLLTSAGAEVHALRHRAAPAPADGATRRATWHDGDLLDQRRLRDLLAAINPEFVVHLAAYGARPGEADRERMIAVNVHGSAALWSALPDGVRRVVIAGTCREYAEAEGPVAEDYPCDPRSPYVASKHAAVVLLSAFAREDRRSLVVLRPFGPYGPGDDSNRVLPFAIRRLIAEEPVLLSPGDQMCDFAFVDDHARAFALAAVANVPEPVAIYNIGSGVSMSLRSVIETAADAVGGGARDRLQFGALPYRPGDSRAVCADISAARRDLGYEATVPLRDGLERTVRWTRSLVRA